MTANMVEALPYSDGQAADWDAFVRKARAPFLFERPYMDYHRARFPDASLLFFEGGRLIALFPATAVGNTVFSHSGLTYGGLIHERAPTARVIELFNVLSKYYEGAGLFECEYKPVPYIYADYPAQQDLYALFRLGATLQARAISASIPIPPRMSFSELRKRGVRKSARAGAIVIESDDFHLFWPMLDATLEERHSARPVHTLAEILILRSRFPQQIRLFLAATGGSVGGGCVIYDVGSVAHIQYIASTAQGRENGLLDALFDHVINHVAVEEGKSWVDLGVSTEQGGRVLNANLTFQKEGFGGRGIVYDTYRYPLSARIS